MMNLRRFLMVVLLLSLYPATLWADESRIVPSVALKEQYNTNILLSADDMQRDFITILSPGVELVDRSDRLDTDLSARLDLLAYSHHRDLNATNQSYNGKLKYLTSPISFVSVEGGYLKDHNPSLETGMPVTSYIVCVDCPSGNNNGNNNNENNNNSSNNTNNNNGNDNNQSQDQLSRPFAPVVSIPVNQISSSLSVDYSFTEKAAATASYTYARNYYKDPRYQDGTSHAVNAGLIYDLGQYLALVKGRLNTGYSYYNFSDSVVENVMATVGFSRDFNETWSISADGGIRRTWSKIWITQPVLTGTEIIDGHEYMMYTNERELLKNKGWGKVGNVSLHYQGEYGNYDLAYVRDLTMASGINGAAERNALNFSTLYRLTYELSLSLGIGYSTYKSDSSDVSPYAINQRTIAFGPGLRYNFTKDAAVEASYAFTKIDGTASYAAANAAASNIEAKRQITFIRLNVQHAFLE